MRLLLLMSAILVGLSMPAMARPVSYPGGWTVMQMNDLAMSGLHIHYTPSIKYSIGYKAEYWRDDKWQFHGLQVNNLLKRWNKAESQANFYIKSAAGVAYSDRDSFDGKTEAAAFTGLSLDWENRRFFTMYENRLTYAGDIDKLYMQKARVGVAPYIGDYGDIHTWLMLEVDHSPERKEEVVVTPLIRMFKGVYLFETGVSNNGDFLFNTVIRF